MKEESHLDSVMRHSALWSEWRKDENLCNRVRRAIEDRRPFVEVLKRYIRRLAKERGGLLRVLEEGCGTAIDSCVLKREFPGVDFHAIDLSEKAIELADKISGLMKVSLTAEAGDAMSTRFDAEYFDMIFSQGFVEHFDKPANILSEQRRILKKDGVLIMSVPQRYSLFTIFKKIRMMLGKWAHGWEREYSPREAVDLGIKAGFRVVEIDGYGFTIEDFIRNGTRRINIGFFNEYLSIPIIYVTGGIFFLLSSMLGKGLRRYLCKNLVAVFEK